MCICELGVCACLSVCICELGVCGSVREGLRDGLTIPYSCVSTTPLTLRITIPMKLKSVPRLCPFRSSQIADIKKGVAPDLHIHSNTQTAKNNFAEFHIILTPAIFLATPPDDWCMDPGLVPSLCKIK